MGLSPTILGYYDATTGLPTNAGNPNAVPQYGQVSTNGNASGLGSNGGPGLQSGGGPIQTTPQTMRPFGSISEAMSAYYQGLLQGSNVPLSAYLGNVSPQAGMGGTSGGGTGYSGPFGSIQTGSGTQTGTGSNTGSYDNSTSNTGASSSTGSRNLPPEIKAQLDAFITQQLGRKDYGYTPQELDQMMINPNEARGLVSQIQRPIAGAANKAIQQGTMAAAARGNYAPGLNATLERVQQEEGRAAGEAAQNTRLGISAQNRDAQIAAANARINESGAVRNQIGGLLSGYPEGTTSQTGNTSNTGAGTGSNTGSTNTTQNDTTKSTVTPTNAAGGPLPALGAASPIGLGPGGTGVGAKAAPSAPSTAAKKKPGLTTFL